MYIYLKDNYSGSREWIFFKCYQILLLKLSMMNFVKKKENKILRMSSKIYYDDYILNPIWGSQSNFSFPVYIHVL